MKTEILILNVLLTISLLITIPIFIKRYFIIIAQYMFNYKTNWNKHIDKPRIFTYTISLVLIYFVYDIQSRNIYLYWSAYGINILIILTATFFCVLTWFKKFEIKFIPYIKTQLEKDAKNNFNLKYSDNQLKKLYFLLNQNEFINTKKTSQDSFLEALSQDFDIHDSKIHLKFSGVDARIFYDYFFKIYNVPLKVFTSYSKIIINDNTNEYYNYKSLVSNKIDITRNSDKIIKIFDDISII